MLLIFIYELIIILTSALKLLFKLFKLFVLWAQTQKQMLVKCEAIFVAIETLNLFYFIRTVKFN